MSEIKYRTIGSTQRLGFAIELWIGEDDLAPRTGEPTIQVGVFQHRPGDGELSVRVKGPSFVHQSPEGASQFLEVVSQAVNLAGLPADKLVEFANSKAEA